MLARILIGSFVMLLASLAPGQESQFEGKRIESIEYSPGQILDAADLVSAQPLRQGEPLRAAEVAAAIDGLFATGNFEDIAVEARALNGGVAVRFITKPAWFVGGVNVQGAIATPPNRGELTSGAQFALGTPFHEQDVSRAVDSIRHLMESNGFLQPEIIPEIERDNSGQQVFITIRVKEGKRAKYTTPVIEGDTKLADSTIVRATGWRIPLIHWWRHVTDTRTRSGVEAIQRKYQSQDRLLSHVDLTKMQPQPDGRVQPHLKVEAGPVVKVKALEAKVSRRVLKRYVPIFEEHAVENDLLVQGRRNLQDYFQSQGYYDSDVTFRVIPPKDDVETIEYIVSKGQRFKLERVDLEGNHYFSAEIIRERMLIQPAGLGLWHGRYSEAFRRRDEENISDLYKSNGFRDVQVAITEHGNYHGKAGEVSAMVNIEEGRQWLVNGFDVEGIQLGDGKQLRALISSAPGQPFAEASLARDRDAILTWYYSNGFPDATLKATWQQGLEPRRVNVRYAIAEGRRQFVRDIMTSGLQTTRSSLVKSVMTLKTGDPLSPVEATRIQQRLYNLGVFARVDTAIQNPEGDTAHKYLLYNFEEANRYTLTAGIGAQVARFGQPSSQSLGSPGGSTGFSPEVSLNVTRLNFLGLGHSISLRGAFSTIDKTGSLSYFQPRFRNVDGRNLTYTLFYQDELDVRTFSSRREEASIQLSQKFSKSLTGLFRFNYRRVSVSNVIIPVLLIPQLVQPVRVGILSTNFVQDRRDDPANPHRGVYNTADIGLASSYFGSQRNFGRLLLRNATYYRLTKNLVLARQTQFGVIVPFAAPAGLSAQESVPLPERFFGGGADSLRAFPYNQAGPRDTGAPLQPNGPTSPATGFPLGGNALFFNNVELRFPLIGQDIQGVFFHDMGNVFHSVSDISLRFSQRNLQDFDYTVHAAGFGIRYRTPVGPVRADLAYSINPPAYDGFSGTPLELLRCNPNDPASLAQSFCQPSRQSISHFQFFFSIGQTF
ncbi:MAG TPA: BamA/TamA family outer membrane protein [Bryobacteraceae bacterium]|nr:BamA/TamA family outer membrane protein [Bryobacteraceae bacterium]